jgi:hypothetical protein
MRIESGNMLRTQGFELDSSQLQKSLEKPFLNAAINVTI